MPQYANLSGRSNVQSYEIGYVAKARRQVDLGGGLGGPPEELSIEVTFADGARYLYTESSAGHDLIQEMIRLAKAGRGLNAFISKTVRKKYASKGSGPGRIERGG